MYNYRYIVHLRIIMTHVMIDTISISVNNVFFNILLSYDIKFMKTELYMYIKIHGFKLIMDSNDRKI